MVANPYEEWMDEDELERERQRREDEELLRGLGPNVGLNADWNESAYYIAPKGGKANRTNGAVYLNNLDGDDWGLVQVTYDEEEGTSDFEPLKDFGSVQEAVNYISSHRDELEQRARQKANPRLKAMNRRMPGQRMVAKPRRSNPAADPTPMQRWSKKGVTVGLFHDFSGVLTVATKTGDEDYVPVFRTKSYPAAVKYAEQYMSEVKTNPRRKAGASPTDVGALEARAIARGKREILEDIKSGRVPSAVRTFAELHDYVDANEYGGLTDSPNLFGGVSRHAELSAMNRVQDALDAWLRTGRRAGAKHKVVASNPRPAKRSRYEGLDTAIMLAASSIAGNVADTRDHATVWSSPLEAVNMSEGTAELLWREGEFGSSTGYPFEKAWPSIKRDALGMTKSIWIDVKHNPRPAKHGSSRSGRTAAQSNAAKAMKLFHSGQASSLAEAWAMLRRR
jgi:hypothetical protein